MKMTAVIGCTASSPQNGVFPGNCSGSLRMNSLQTKHSISGSYHPSRGIFISKAMSIGAVPGINSNHLNYGIRIIHFFRGYQGFPQRRDQRHSGPFHHVPHRFRTPPHSDFQWLVPLALANFTGTFVTRQPLLREGQAYAEIRRYGVYDAITFDEWSENNDIKPSSLCAENSN